MPIKKALLGAAILLSVYSCEEDLAYELVDNLPLSTIEYSEIIDGESFTETYTEGPDYRFEDKREYRRDSCGQFMTRIDMINPPVNNRSISLLFFSRVSLDKLEDNKIIFKDPLEFEKHLNQQPLDLYDLSNPCDLREEETAILLITVQSENSGLLGLKVSTIESGEVRQYEFTRTIHNDLGYLVITAEFEYSAQQFLFTSQGVESELIPVKVKFQHPIRFPELDK